jgi:UPF0716 protein FxsA
MSLVFRLFLLFTIVPLVDLVILLKINSWLGFGATLLLVLGTGALGAALAKYQGWVTWNRIRQDLSMGIVPSGRLIDGVLILIAGILLITPGLLTDTCGFALLIPPVRDRIKRSIRDWLQRKVASGEYRIHFGPF